MTAAEIITYLISVGVLFAALSFVYWVGRSGRESQQSQTVPKLSAERSGELFPDWTIRELFFHIDPHALDGDDDRWQSVGQLILDNLSIGRLKAWGRPLPKDSEESSLVPIPYKHWNGTELTYFFLGENDRYVPDTYPPSGGVIPQYADLQINRIQALGIWPNQVRREE